MSGESEAVENEREVDFQQDLGYALRDAIRSKPKYKRKEFEAARLEYEVEEGRADIAVLETGGKPFLIIETKRKNGRIQKDIDPWNPKVIHQALRYAVLKGAPYFATANRGYLAAFRTPERREEFSIPKHRVFATPIESVNQEFGSSLLVRLVDYELAETDQDRANLTTALDWTFVYRLRSFADWLYRRTLPSVRKRIAGQPEFEERVRAMGRDRGTSLSADQLAREMVYVLLNKVLFYKALERRYPRLPRLNLPETDDLPQILHYLNNAWKDATRITDDFESIFSTRLYDDISFDEGRVGLIDLHEGIQGFIEDMERYRLEELEADVIGHVYEHLIPEEERHRLGKFYTPPAIAELITRWAIRADSDRVFDPAAGSGTFLVKAYLRLKELKRDSPSRPSGPRLHAELLGQLYANDIDAFAGHLTAMNLAIRDVRHPVSEVNIAEADFFELSPGTGTVTASKLRRPRIPVLDVIVGNPPYTRWTELTETQQDSVSRHLNRVLREYDLVARVRSGVETALYQHFVIHATSFLKDGGRLGMIISNSWLQTDVGISFGHFLLDNFKVKAVIDFGPRVFTLPIVATTVVLLERCTDEAARALNQSIFAMVSEPTSVDDLLRMIERPGDFSAREQVRILSQDKIPRDSKWLGVFFEFENLDLKIRGKSVPISSLFDVTKGTIGYCAEEKRGLGANSFFRLTADGVRQWGLANSVSPCLPSGRYFTHLVFNESDWRELEKQGKPAYLFDCRKARDEVSKSVRDYISWGETDCRNRDDEICSRSQSCVERARKRGYAGWYDVGGIQPADLLSTYYSQHRHRFALLRMRIAVDHDFIAFRSKSHLSEVEKKAILACLNSTLGRVYVETQGRATGGGMISMEDRHALKIPVIDPRSTRKADVGKLAQAFDRLEKGATSRGGLPDSEAEDSFATEYRILDDAVATALNLSKKELSQLKDLCAALVARRNQRVEQPEVEAVRGIEEERSDLRKPRMTRSKVKSVGPRQPIESFLTRVE